MESSSPASRPAETSDDRQLDEFLARIQARFLANLAAADNQLFVTDARGLYDAFLDEIPDRQQYTCRACRTFVEDFGGLVTIGDGGELDSAIWHYDDAPAYYRQSVVAMLEIIARSQVDGVFKSSLATWGRPTTGPWKHLALAVPPSFARDFGVKTAGQAAAEKREDYNMVQRALHEFSRDKVDQAVALLESEALYRAEKVAGPMRWFRALHAAVADVRRPRTRENLIWRAVASAPAGFCHVRSSMAGTLLEDLAAGLPVAEVSRKFAAKMNPLQYQRPQAAPSEGNLDRAEKLVAQLGIANSLKRRYARLDEVEALWTPTKPAAVDAPGVFAHLRPAAPGSSPVVVPNVTTITWEKFARTVLPGARSIEFYTGSRIPNYGALVTAADPDAPPIIRWDRPERRNPVTWYVYSGGSSPMQWRLPGSSYVKVTAICPSPSHWRGAEPHEGDAPGVAILIEGARDTRNAALALFPEFLKGELREVRSSIEAFSKAGRIEGGEQASACGMLLSKSSPGGAVLRVTTDSLRQDFLIDRWD